MRTTVAALALALATTTMPAAAQEASQADDFSAFAPRASASDIRLDYRAWQDALEWFVLDMGPSLREFAGRPDPVVGSRFIYDHQSRYRLEGNRIAFSMLDDDVRASLTEYRTDLERIGGEVDIAGLPRNEQLAFWLNLHNAAMIERIALAYPVKQPRSIRVDGEPLDTARFLSIGGRKLSLNDIRTRIVYPNWDDPKVIYGFFRGDIGGPSIQREPYTGSNVGTLLNLGADEFVNSLRGTQAKGPDLAVSRIYAEAAGFYFPQMGADLRAHLARYANADVRPLVDSARNLEPTTYDFGIADLANGQRETSLKTQDCVLDLTQVSGGIDCVPNDPRVPPNVRRFTAEREEKIRQLARRGLLTGRIIIIPEELLDDSEVR